MFSRALLVGLTAFWLTMNFLLWRAEYGKQPSVGSTVPAKVVWEKILTAPDSSSLTILKRGKRLGFCHWITSVSEDLSHLSSNDAPPEGLVRKIVNYRLELDGNILIAEPAERVRFDTHLTLGPDKSWQDFDLRLNLRPGNWQIHGVAAEQTVRVNWQEDTESFTRVFTFAELQHPEALVRELGGPVVAAMLEGTGLFPDRPGNASPSVELNWQARLVPIKLGHSSVRAYRLETRVLNRFAVVVFVSRVGEILRIELPDGIVLANDQLGGN